MARIPSLRRGLTIFVISFSLFKCIFSLLTQQHHQRIEILAWSGIQGWAMSGNLCHVNTTGELPHCREAREVNNRWRIKKSSIDLQSDVPGEGITLSVLNQRDGSLLLRKIFPLAKYWAYWADLQWHIQHIASGRIVVMAVSVRGCIGLREAVHYLSGLGSLFAQHLPPSAHWIWVFIKGGRTISETAVIDGSVNAYLDVLFDLSQDLPLHHKTSNKLERKRWLFCEKYGGVGNLCDESSPAPLPLPLANNLTIAQSNTLEKVPVIITAGIRYPYLYYTLIKILSAPGARPENFLVVLGDAPPPTIELLLLLDINYAILPVQGTGNNKLLNYYKTVFKLIADIFSESENVILLDEDVEVSPDFFSYMSQTIWLLQSDPTIYCINGHGRHKRVSHNIKKVLRGRSMVSWGYAISLTFVKEALTLWMTIPIETSDYYDLWLFDNVAKGRECIFPDVSRTRHHGIGINVIPMQFEFYFQAIPLVQESGVPLSNVNRLLLPQWKKDLTTSIIRAKPITGNPCSDTFMPMVSNPGYYVFYINMSSTSDGHPDVLNYYLASSCLGVWDLSDANDGPHELHEGVATFTFSPETTLYVVGVPYSSYAYLRDTNIKPWTSETNVDGVKKYVRKRNNLDAETIETTSDILRRKLIINPRRLVTNPPTYKYRKNKIINHDYQ